MKQEQGCPTDRLSKLVEDELSPAEAGAVMEHLDRCEVCQAELVASAADEPWWHRVSRGLSGIVTDGDGLLPPQTTSLDFVETLVDVGGNKEPSKEPVDLTTLMEPPTHPEMLGRIDEFDIESKIGQGGMGIVLRGFDRSLNRPVAIKIMSPHLGSNDLARQRFAREAQAAAAVVNPYVVPIYRVSDSPDRPYIAMALVDGRSLQEHVDSNGPMAVKDIVRVAAQVAEGLAAAHQQGLVHRDVKPANVLIEMDISRIWITDFGLARAIDDISMTQSGCLAGTPHYMSPEHVTGRTVDHRSDLFSLGGLMYFLATGHEPFRSGNAFSVISKIVHETPMSAHRLNAEIPETLDRIIALLLEMAADVRLQSAEETRGLLTQYLAHLQAPEQNRAPAVDVPPSRRRRTMKRLVLVILILAGLAAAIVIPQSLSTNPDTGNGAMFPTGEHAEHHRDTEGSERHGDRH